MDLVNKLPLAIQSEVLLFKDCVQLPLCHYSFCPLDGHFSTVWNRHAAGKKETCTIKE